VNIFALQVWVCANRYLVFDLEEIGERGAPWGLNERLDAERAAMPSETEIEALAATRLDELHAGALGARDLHGLHVAEGIAHGRDGCGRHLHQLLARDDDLSRGR
jgi:hypothetical protein